MPHLPYRTRPRSSVLLMRCPESDRASAKRGPSSWSHPDSSSAVRQNRSSHHSRRAYAAGFASSPAPSATSRQPGNLRRQYSTRTNRDGNSTFIAEPSSSRIRRSTSMFPVTFILARHIIQATSCARIPRETRTSRKAATQNRQRTSSGQAQKSLPGKASEPPCPARKESMSLKSRRADETDASLRSLFAWTALTRSASLASKRCIALPRSASATASAALRCAISRTICLSAYDIVGYFRLRFLRRDLGQ